MLLHSSVRWPKVLTIFSKFSELWNTVVGRCGLRGVSCFRDTNMTWHGDRGGLLRTRFLTSFYHDTRTLRGLS